MKPVTKGRGSVLLALAVAGIAVMCPATGLNAQDTAQADQRATVPFGPGEQFTYDVRVGLFGQVGESSLEVVGIDTVRGSPTYHLRLLMQGGIPLARVDNRFESWMETRSLAALRFEQQQREARYRRYRMFDFFPEEKRWIRLDIDDEGDLPTDMPLDQVSFLYFVRTMPLVVGETYTMDRYFQERGNPVVIKVLRRDTVTVPAGTFATIVVEPIIQTRGLFGEGGEARVYFTDDERRMLVKLDSRMPILRTLRMELKSYQTGTPLVNSDTSKNGYF